MQGDEVKVVDAFCAWLSEHGWTVEREVAFVDVVATRGTQKIFAEAKGRTAAVGLDVDTLYGQLLRRMPNEEVGSTDFAVVLPDRAVPAALRVPERVRQLLHIHVHGVTDAGGVQLWSTGPDPAAQDLVAITDTASELRDQAAGMYRTEAAVELLVRAGSVAGSPPRPAWVHIDRGPTAPAVDELRDDARSPTPPF